MKISVALIACLLCAALPTRAGNEKPPLSPKDELTVRNCVALIQIPRDALKPELERSNNKRDLTNDNCVEVLSRRGTSEQRNKIELPNHSTDAQLANCARAFFAIADDGTEFDIEPDRSSCGIPATCTATITVLATDGLHSKTLNVSGGLIELQVHPTGRWLNLQSGGFSCTPSKANASKPL